VDAALTPTEDDARVARAFGVALCWGAVLGVGALIQGTGLLDPLLGAACCAVAAIALGAPIILQALQNVRSGTHDLHELIALSIAGAFAFEDHRTAATLALLATLGELVEHRTALGARAAIEALVRLAPTRARVLRPDGGEEELPAEQVTAGQRVRLRPGDRVPVDGVVREGASTLDEKAITGESVPAEKVAGDEVFAGTTNVSGTLVVEVTRAGKDTTLSRVQELILAAERSRPPVARLIDRVVQRYLPLTLMLAALVLFFTRDVTRVLALVVIAGPSALVLATPTATVAALSAAARLGILIKDARDLEVASRLTRVVFDKTGTLTHGRLVVTRLAPADGFDPADALRLAAALAQRSTHPASRAVVEVAREAELPLPEPEELREVQGAGLAGRVEGRAVALGRAALLEREGCAPRALDAALEAGDQSLLHLAVDGQHVATFALDDTPRPEAREVVARLTSAGLRVGMLTGDRWPVARRVARELGIAEAEVVAECLPHEKLEVVQRARGLGDRVAVVGDGINDAPALAATDLGVALGARTDVALHSARVALLHDDLTRLPFLIELARRTRTVVLRNIAFGLLFIAAGVALASLGLLSPVAALLLHNAGDLAVVLHSARLVREGEELG